MIMGIFLYFLISGQLSFKDLLQEINEDSEEEDDEEDEDYEDEPDTDWSPKKKIAKLTSKLEKVESMLL